MATLFFARNNQCIGLVLPTAIVESGANPDDCDEAGIMDNIRSRTWSRQTLADQDHATSSGKMSTSFTTQWILRWDDSAQLLYHAVDAWWQSWHVAKILWAVPKWSKHYSFGQAWAVKNTKSNYKTRRWLHEYMTEQHQVEDLPTTELNC